MAAQLVGACFSCSLIHPQRPLDFATYTPLELWEGSNLFHDPYRSFLPGTQHSSKHLISLSLLISDACCDSIELHCHHCSRVLYL